MARWALPQNLLFPEPGKDTACTAWSYRGSRCTKMWGRQRGGGTPGGTCALQAVQRPLLLLLQLLPALPANEAPGGEEGPPRRQSAGRTLRPLGSCNGAPFRKPYLKTSHLHSKFSPLLKTTQTTCPTRKCTDVTKSKVRPTRPAVRGACVAPVGTSHEVQVPAVHPWPETLFPSL